MNGLTAMNGDYSLSKAWYPSLEYKINFLCGPICSNEISEKYKDKMITDLMAKVGLAKHRGRRPKRKSAVKRES